MLLILLVLCLPIHLGHLTSSYSDRPTCFSSQILGTHLILWDKMNTATAQYQVARVDKIHTFDILARLSALQSVTVEAVDCHFHNYYVFLWFGHKPSWTRYLGWLISTQILTKELSLNDQAYYCLIHFRDNCRVTSQCTGRRPLTEEDLLRKVTFDGRWPLTEDDHWRKTTIDRRHPLDRRRPLTEDDL